MKGARRLAGAGRLVLVAIGCGTTMDIPAAEVPHLDDASNVVTVEGEQRAVPERWTARIIGRELDEWRLMTPDGSGPVRALPVPRSQVELATENGWTEHAIELSRPAGGRLDGPLRRGRDDRGRRVEVPLALVERVEVTDVDAIARRNAGIAVAVVPGGVAVLAAFAFLVCGYASMR